MSKVKVTDKKLDEWIERNCTTGVFSPYPQEPEREKITTIVSKIDGGYLTFINLKNDLKWLVAKGIEQPQMMSTDGKVCCIGFNPEKQKWYGWSHRAVFGFGVGSEVKKGDCGYVCTDINDFIESSIKFWESESTKNLSAIPATNDKGVQGVQVTYEYVPEFVPNKSLHGTIGEQFMYPPAKWGKGEWKAETLEDAKQMAIDFAEGIS